MKKPIQRFAALLGLIACLALLPGCIETKISVDLAADGSGSRRVEMAWKQGDLHDLDLTIEELRVILDLPAERGWSMRHESRPVRDGSLEPHVIFERSVEMNSLEAWQREGQDIRINVNAERAARMHDEILVEVGRGAGYRTVSYTERLDGHEIRALMDRVAARILAEKFATVWPEIGETATAEIRGLLLGHIRHFDVWSMEDGESDDAWEDLIVEVGPQIESILVEAGLSHERIHDTHAMMHEVLNDDEVDAWQEKEFPGLSLLAVMNLKFEITLPGVIVESNADRTGKGYAGWERSAWDAIEAPLEFRVRSRIEP